MNLSKTMYYSGSGAFIGSTAGYLLCSSLGLGTKLTTTVGAFAGAYFGAHMAHSSHKTGSITPPLSMELVGEIGTQGGGRTLLNLAQTCKHFFTSLEPVRKRYYTSLAQDCATLLSKAHIINPKSWASWQKKTQIIIPKNESASQAFVRLTNLVIKEIIIDNSISRQDLIKINFPDSFSKLSIIGGHFAEFQTALRHGFDPHIWIKKLLDITPIDFIANAYSVDLKAGLIETLIKEDRLFETSHVFSKCKYRLKGLEKKFIEKLIHCDRYKLAYEFAHDDYWRWQTIFEFLQILSKDSETVLNFIHGSSDNEGKSQGACYLARMERTEEATELANKITNDYVRRTALSYISLCSISQTTTNS